MTATMSNRFEETSFFFLAPAAVLFVISCVLMLQNCALCLFGVSQSYLERLPLACG